MKDQIAIGVISGLAIALIIWFIRAINDKKDTNTILKYLRESKNSTKYQFRSNHVIASSTNLSVERVRNLCSKSKMIKRNTNEKESWKLIND